jgi:hypothetical protein
MIKKDSDQKPPKSVPDLRTKPLNHLQALVKNSKPKNMPMVNRTIQKKVGRGG